MTFIERAARGLARRIGLRSGGGPVVGREEGAGFYDRMYAATADYHAPYQESFYYFLWSVIADRLRLSKTERVLEIGCGPGQMAEYLMDQGVREYTGLDFSPEAIRMAKSRLPRGTFVVGDARDPAIHKQVPHDVVLCTEVLEHIDHDLSVVAAFTPGKRCLCSVPNFPYESHVRHFADADEVRARYGRFFTGLDVATFRSPRDPKDQFFLFDGVRNDETGSQ